MPSQSRLRLKTQRQETKDLRTKSGKGGAMALLPAGRESEDLTDMFDDMSRILDGWYGHLPAGIDPDNAKASCVE